METLNNDRSPMNSSSSMGWVKLPNGPSFPIEDVSMLGSIYDSFDNAERLKTVGFRIVFTDKTFVDCFLYDFESLNVLNNKLERFRDQIAIARWGEKCIKIEN
jgi:hypothetical protein